MNFLTNAIEIMKSEYKLSFSGCFSISWTNCSFCTACDGLNNFSNDINFGFFRCYCIKWTVSWSYFFEWTISCFLC